MANCSPSTVVFQWDKVSSPYILEVEPPVGELIPHGELDVEVTINSQYPGTIKHTLLCHVQHLEHPLTLSVQASVKVHRVSKTMGMFAHAKNHVGYVMCIRV